MSRKTPEKRSDAAIHPSGRTLEASVARLLETAIESTPLRMVGGPGYSGAILERVVLADRTTLIVKHLSPRWDLSMRLTRDAGRAARLWISGALNRLPPIIDHAIVAAEPDRDGWIIVMRDVSAALIPEERVLTRAESYRVLEAATALHHTFRGERVDGLCTLDDHLSLFTPELAARQNWENHGLFRSIARGWELFFNVVPRDVATAISAIHQRPQLLVKQLEQHAMTLIHGDLWLANFGLLPDRVVIIDWSMATWAPPAFEFTSFLTGNWSRIAATREELIADFRTVSGEHHDERALRLSFLGTFAEFGWNKAIDAVEHADASIRAREKRDLDWWIRRTRDSLEEWSPV